MKRRACSPSICWEQYACVVAEPPPDNAFAQGLRATQVVLRRGRDVVRLFWSDRERCVGWINRDPKLRKRVVRYPVRLTVCGSIDHLGREGWVIDQRSS